MARYPYTGTEARQYSQYIDLDGSYPADESGPARTGPMPLLAEPGGAYDMAPAAGCEGMPVPPGDGRWGEHALGDVTLPEMKEAPAGPPASGPPAEDDSATPKIKKGAVA